MAGRRSFAAASPAVRVTHPNTTDVLIETYDAPNARWQISYYDSGMRNITSLVTSGTNNECFLRRMNGVVIWSIGVTAFTSAATAFTFPDGFKPINTTLYVPKGYGAGAQDALIDAYNFKIYGTTAVLRYNGSSFGTTDAIPVALPGTNQASAPYA